MWSRGCVEGFVGVWSGLIYGSCWVGFGQAEGSLADLLLDWSFASVMVTMAPPPEIWTSLMPPGGTNTWLMVVV